MPFAGCSIEQRAADLLTRQLQVGHGRRQPVGGRAVEGAQQPGDEGEIGKQKLCGNRIERLRTGRAQSSGDAAHASEQSVQCGDGGHLDACVRLPLLIVQHAGIISGTSGKVEQVEQVEQVEK